MIETMLLPGSATESDTKVYKIRMDRIHSDESFNCRGYIPPSDVIDLARDIKENGLQYPILVHTYDEAHRLRTGKDFRIISGHRRYTAFIVNKEEEIPAIIREGVSEVDALIMNLNENTQRKELNILQEAKAVKRLREYGMTQDDVARRLKKSRPWAQVRFYVLDFPDDIQEAIGEGWISQAQIHQIHSLPDQGQQYAAVRKIKDAKLSEGTKRLKVEVDKPPKKENLHKAKERKKAEIETMLDHLMENGPPNLATRALAWCAGNITSISFLQDFQEFMLAEHGVKYEIPEDGIAGL